MIHNSQSLKSALAMLLVLLMAKLAIAQTVAVTGNVMSDAGTPLPNVSIQVKDGATGTTTDSSGNFTLTVANANAILVFSSVGYIEREEPLNGRTEVTVVLTASAQSLEQVVVIGYGTQRKENITGSIGVISSKDLQDRPNPNPVSSIQGKVSGVQILNSGAPGGSPRIDIRGISSVTGKTVFIVDGMITDDISFLNPQDIESMSILKDASSLAIFGAQASNGAVIIKTKSGKGKPIFNLNSYVGVKSVTNIPDMVNADQYIQLYNEKLNNEKVKDPVYLSRADTTANTNWFDEVFKSAIIHSTDFSVQGKWKPLGYFVSVGYLNDGGTLNAGKGVNSGNDFRRFTGRANLSYKISNSITIGNNFTWTKTNTNNANNPLLTAYNAPPVYAPINPSTNDYTRFTLVSLTNPRASLDLFRSKNDENRFLENIWGEVKFLKDFTFRISYSIDNRKVDRYQYTAISTYLANPNRATLEDWDEDYKNYVWDNTLSWKKSMSEHNFEVLAGYSRTQNHYNGIWRQAWDVNYTGDESSLDIAKGVDQIEADHVRYIGKLDPYKNRIESQFGRINYDYAGKYLINGSVRRDGATGFSPDDRYRIFPAISAGWVISKEGFMQDQNIFSFLKLRGSWGQLGNPNVTRAYTLATTVFNEGAYFGGTGFPAETITEVIDPTIGWETTEGTDFGLEMGFLKNKLKVEATLFNKLSNDVVYRINQPAVSGASNASTFITNAYSFRNKGFEGAVNYDGKISNGLRFGVYANITTLNNKITDVYGGSFNEPGPYLFGNTIVRLQLGQPVGAYYGYKVAGTFQNQAEVDAAPTQNGKTVGGFKFADVDGNNLIDNRDKTFLGSPIPKYTYGFGFNLIYNSLDFGIDFQGVQGNQIYNYNRERRFGNETWDLDMYNNRWKGEGTSNTNAMITNNQAIILPNSFYVEDGSYFRIRNIVAGYTLSQRTLQSLGMQKIRFYLGAQNPLTTFKYNGFSPEILSTDRVQMGVDNNIYPLSATYTLGVNVIF